MATFFIVDESNEIEEWLTIITLLNIVIIVYLL